MFRDEEDDVKAEIIELLKLYSLEEILDEADVTPEEALTYLYMNGYILLPEVKPL